MNDIQQAFELYNETAKKTGIKSAQVLSDTRKRNIKARLDECGGMDGWHIAMQNIEDSAFLRGDNDRGWVASLDFVITKSKFIKIMEGGYKGEAKKTKNEQIKQDIYDWSQTEGEWSLEDKKKLSAFVHDVAMGQRKEKDFDIKAILRRWQRKFYGRFTVDQIIYAVDKHTDNNDWFPTINNITTILEPQEPEITPIAYMQACKEYEQSGFNQFTDAYDIKCKYEAQNKQKQEQYKIECDKVKQIVNNSIKSLTG